MARDLRIELRNQGVVTLPGEVSGHIVVEASEPKPYKSITVTLKGYADVHWTETVEKQVQTGHVHVHGHGHGHVHHHNQPIYETRTEIIHHRSHEDFVNDAIVVWDHKSVPTGALGPGQYSWPFRFTVYSTGHPSSFAGSQGQIRYEIEAQISTGLLHFDKTVSTVLQVVDVVDINVPALMQPAHYEVEKKVLSLLSSSHPIVLTVDIPRTGFLVNEAIPFTANVINGSNRTISLKGTIKSTETYRANGRVRTDSRDVKVIETAPIKEHTEFKWAPTDMFPAPSTSPTISNCAIINVEYNLIVEAVIPMAIDSSITVPITLGTTRGQPSGGGYPPAQSKSPSPATNPFQGPPSAAPYSQIQPSGPQHQSAPSGALYPQGPPPGAQYQGPPPGAQYQGPPPGAQYQGPPSGAQYQGPPSGAQYQGPPPGAQYQGPPPGAQYYQSSFPGAQYYQGPPFGAQYQVPPPAAQYQVPPQGTQYYQGPPQSAAHPGQVPSTQHQGPPAPPAASSYQANLIDFD